MEELLLRACVLFCLLFSLRDLDRLGELLVWRDLFLFAIFDDEGIELLFQIKDQSCQMLAVIAAWAVAVGVDRLGFKAVHFEFALICVLKVP